MNLLYFFFYFICIATFNVLRLSSIEIAPYFYLYSIAQALFEVGIFFLIAYFLRKRPWIYSAYLTLLFSIILVHYAHFTIHRLTDSSVSLFFKFFNGHGIDHVFKVFHALNMNHSMLLLIGLAFLFLPFISIGLYRLTSYLFKPREVSAYQIVSTVAIVGLFLISFEWFAIREMPYSKYEKYIKTLAFSAPVFSPQIALSTLKLSPPYNQSEALKPFEISVAEKPNIYLFIIETLRKDFITEEVAPNLYAFGKENIQFPLSHSNANSTQHSWFAIFHSLNPLHWSSFPKVGSSPLQILKNLGYKIHVYSSADLRYFEMDQMIFGPEMFLADTIEEYANLPIESWEKDARVLQSFEKNSHDNQGNIFIFFLDATHSEYSFPHEKCFFQPIVKKIDYLTLNVKNIEPIINRYRNSVHYIDTLMDRFTTLLKEKKLYDKAIIAITGDHGEEFFEEGSLFHGTHLNEAQTSIPIFFKFPTQCDVLTNSVTHVDIFPTILDYITKKCCDLFEGNSIFQKQRSPYRFTVAQNGAKTPSEFTLHTLDSKLHARFVDPDHMYTNCTIEVLEQK